MGLYTELWLLMPWCWSTRASASPKLTKYHCVGSVPYKNITVIVNSIRNSNNFWKIANVKGFVAPKSTHEVNFLTHCNALPTFPSTSQRCSAHSALHHCDVLGRAGHDCTILEVSSSGFHPPFGSRHFPIPHIVSYLRKSWGKYLSHHSSRCPPCGIPDNKFPPENSVQIFFFQ